MECALVRAVRHAPVHTADAKRSLERLMLWMCWRCHGCDGVAGATAQGTWHARAQRPRDTLPDPVCPCVRDAGARALRMDAACRQSAPCQLVTMAAAVASHEGGEDELNLEAVVRATRRPRALARTQHCVAESRAVGLPSQSHLAVRAPAPFSPHTCTTASPTLASRCGHTGSRACLASPSVPRQVHRLCEVRARAPGRSQGRMLKAWLRSMHLDGRGHQCGGDGDGRGQRVCAAVDAGMPCGHPRARAGAHAAACPSRHPS